jgi:hypothetical protein
MVDRANCDGMMWQDGTVFWEECCVSCMKVQMCEEKDWWTDCVEMIDGESCDDRLWEDGTVFWEECCESCMDVSDIEM